MERSSPLPDSIEFEIVQAPLKGKSPHNEGISVVTPTMNVSRGNDSSEQPDGCKRKVSVETMLEAAMRDTSPTPKTEQEIEAGPTDTAHPSSPLGEKDLAKALKEAMLERKTPEPAPELPPEPTIEEKAAKDAGSASHYITHTDNRCINLAALVKYVQKSHTGSSASELLKSAFSVKSLEEWKLFVLENFIDLNVLASRIKRQQLNLHDINLEDQIREEISHQCRVLTVVRSTVFQQMNVYFGQYLDDVPEANSDLCISNLTMLIEDLTGGFSGARLQNLEGVPEALVTKLRHNLQA